MRFPGLGSTLFPVPSEVSAGMDPETIASLRRAALLQMGLGMMAAGEKGAGLGAGAMYGMNEGQRTLGAGLGQAWTGLRAAREDSQEARRQAYVDWQKQFQTEGRQLEQQDRATERAYRTQRDAASDRFRSADDARAEEQLDLSRAAAGRAADAVARAQTTQERALAMAKQEQINEARRRFIGQQIAIQRGKGRADTDPLMQRLLTEYETLAGGNSLRSKANPLDLLIQGGGYDLGSVPVD